MSNVVTVVIPTYNRANTLKHVLSALALQTHRDFCVIVVDDGSDDDTASVVASAAQQLGEHRITYRWICRQGPALARNRGLDEARSRFVLFLDSDVCLSPEWIERALQKFNNDKNLACVGGKVLYASDSKRLNAYGGELGQFGLAWDHCEGEWSTRVTEPERKLWLNTSACLCLRSACLSVNGFDERFFYGYEDSDFGWRLNLAGYHVCVFPDLEVLHRVSPSTTAANQTNVFYYCKNRLRSILKNASGWRLITMLALYGGYTTVDLFARGPRKPKLKALLWNVRYLPETWKLRKIVQSSRRRSDRDLLPWRHCRWFPPEPLAGQARRTVPVAESID
ncbi:MAG: glycosyltransferase family 2 protein, partial [Gammaproteobacteria bacterium]